MYTPFPDPPLHLLPHFPHFTHPLTTHYPYHLRTHSPIPSTAPLPQHPIHTPTNLPNQYLKFTHRKHYHHHPHTTTYTCPFTHLCLLTYLRNHHPSPLTHLPAHHSTHHHHHHHSLCVDLLLSRFLASIEIYFAPWTARCYFRLILEVCAVNLYLFTCVFLSLYLFIFIYALYVLEYSSVYNIYLPMLVCLHELSFCMFLFCLCFFYKGKNIRGKKDVYISIYVPVCLCLSVHLSIFVCL